MNYIQKRKIRKIKKEATQVLGVAVLGLGLTILGWFVFEERLTYKECYIYKTRSCEGR